MSMHDFLLILIVCSVTMLASRVLPFFLLKGRDLPKNVVSALNLIPPAAFAALVANDIVNPGMFDAGLWPAGAVVISALAVVVVAYISRSLLLSAITGVAAYALLLMFF